MNTNVKTHLFDLDLIGKDSSATVRSGCHTKSVMSQV